MLKRTAAAVLLASVQTAVAQSNPFALASPRSAQNVASVSGILGTTRVLHLECKLGGDSAALNRWVKRAGFELVEFAPPGQFFRFTRKAVDVNYGMIAKNGQGRACGVMAQIVRMNVPGYFEAE